jgi:hypothetical protein
MEKQIMLKRIFPILLTLAVFLSACGAQGTPTMAPVDVQNTAVAAAWTMVAATQMAIPTATPIPPTEVPSPTPLPTFTAIPLEVLPTLPLVSLPTATSASSDSNCLKPLNMGEAGITSPIRIENVSGGTLTSVSLNLLEGSNKFGQCGAITVLNIGPGSSKTLQVPKGNWWAYAWITYKDGSTGNASGSFTLNQAFEDLVSIVVKKEVIVAK